jgi:GxxExxY protein
MAEKDLPHGNITRVIIECFYQVYRELGAGFSERVYQRAMRIVLMEHGFRVGYNVEMCVIFHGHNIGTWFADLVVNETVLLEIKARPDIEPADYGQVINYLKVAGGGVALLLNFGPKSAEFKRVVQGDPLNSLPNLRRE